MDWRLRQKTGLLVVILLGLVSCNEQTPQNKNKPGTVAQRALLTGKLVINNPEKPGSTIPLVGIRYRSGGNGKTAATGLFRYQRATEVSFTLFGSTIGPIPAKGVITEDDLATALCTAASNIAQCQYAAAKNLQRLLLSVDADLKTDNGITIHSKLSGAPAVGLSSSLDVFELELGKTLNKEGRTVASLFQPSLGINLEAAQPEADEVGGQPLPFADVFRVARPFPEYSCTDITYDANGWPTSIPPSCATQTHPVLRTPSYATALLLRYVPYGAIPTGKYTVLYEGSGNLQYSGIANKLTGESQQGRDVLEITPELLSSRSSAGLRVQLKDIDNSNPVRNIRIVMPGGTCTGNPLVRVESSTACKKGQYQSFVSQLESNRNAIVFNPDYLRFLKDFKVVRTMNLMEASPRNPCYALRDEAYTTCLLQAFTWDQRAKLDDATWGGSARTDLLKRYARGVPLEVVVALANTLNRDPWFNIPHNATDDYVTQYATYVRDNLKPNLKAHLEYSNEPWNGIFWAALYVREKGKALDSNPYRAGYKYYSTRAVQVFNIWHDVFGGAERLVRILNTYHPDEWMSRNMLGYNGNYQFVDAIASAPYFQGCWDRSSNAACADSTKNPLVIKEATSVDDLFNILDNPNNPYGMKATQYWMGVQAKIAKDFGVSYLGYEGGQHLVVNWGDPDPNLSLERRNKILDLIRAANRDIRMAGRYSQFLNDWKNGGGELLALYTLPQTWHKFGTFGIKEHLNQTRTTAPKYDMGMQFQEMLGKCWWVGCE